MFGSSGLSGVDVGKNADVANARNVQLARSNTREAMDTWSKCEASLAYAGVKASIHDGI